MTEPLLAFALLGAISATSVGAARVVSWLLDRRDYTVSQQSPEAAFVVQAEADLAAKGAVTEFQRRAASLPKCHRVKTTQYISNEHWYHSASPNGAIGSSPSNGPTLLE